MCCSKLRTHCTTYPCASWSALSTHACTYIHICSLPPPLSPPARPANYRFIRLGDLEGLQRFAPHDFDWAECGGEYSLPPLVEAVTSGFCQTSCSQTLDMIAWLVECGADPLQQIPSMNDSSWTLYVEQDGTEYNVRFAGHTALSFSLAFLEMLPSLAVWENYRRWSYLKHMGHNS